MRVAIIDYGAGNLHSICKSFESVAQSTGHEVMLTCQASALEDASHIVLPGVGAFGDCRRGLAALDGMEQALTEQVQENKKWFLGICVGMQLLAEEGHEHGQHKGLGWIKGKVKKIAPQDRELKVPHMGWNDLHIRPSSVLFRGINNGAHAYFVHSYAMTCGHDEDIAATVDYGGSIVAAVEKGNILGTQFHPEKSQYVGRQVIHNFLTME